MHNLKNALLFIDGAVHASIWTTGPLLLAALSFPNNVSSIRPRSVEEALTLTGTNSSTKLNQQPTILSEDLRMRIFQRKLPALMAAMLLLFILGRAIGSGCYKSSPFLHRKLQSMPSYVVTCHFIAIILPLIFVNWGWGIYHREWLIFVRFVTASISGLAMAWAKRQPFFYSDNVKGGKGHVNEEINMEEGSALMHSDNNVDKNDVEKVVDSNGHQQQWIDWHWIAGAGCSSLLGGYIFYPLNRLMMALEPKTLVPLSMIVVGMAIHRQLSRHFSATSISSSNSMKVDRTVYGGGDSNDKGTAVTKSTSSAPSSMIQRRKQTSNLDQQQHQQQQQQELYNGKSHSRTRLYSDNSSDSDDQFFDCLDDIELGLPEEPNNSINNSHGNSAVNFDRQIATYSGRKIIYSDGTNAYVPAGESISSTPPGYLSMNNNNQVKSQSKYEATQQWRRSEQIHCIHSQTHVWFQKIKAAYPHVIHGFTPDGMPVLYEAPGKMNLKELLRNGCHVKDMIFHYCYMMEYLSNIESVLSEVNANEVNPDWQEPLAAYAHAKQMRLQNDSIPFGFVVVMDIAGASPSSLSGDVMTYLKQAGDINSAHYPGSMRRAILVQAPFWLGSMWKAIKGILPASVTADLLSGTQTMNGGLKLYIAEDQIPVEYGGTSPFKLGEHPFEIGLKKLAESKAGQVDEASMMSHSKTSPFTPLQEDIPPRLAKRQHHDTIAVPMHAQSNTVSSKRSTLPQGWDGLGASYILVVASLLQLCSYAVIGSIELSMPLWVISPDGMGYESRRSGMACFGTCFVILQALKRVKPHLSSRSIQKNPSKNVRIGILISCVSLACINLIPLTSNHDKSLLGLVCLSALCAFVYLSLVLGVMSVDYLRATAISSSNDCSDLPSGLTFMQSHKSSPVLVFLGRVVGYVCFLAIYLGSGMWFLAAYCAITACILTSFLL
ncbi:hypothetical protein ACHAWT_001895 [Skeletonema menzelii]